jgi:hypothetical protein
MYMIVFFVVRDSFCFALGWCYSFATNFEDLERQHNFAKNSVKFSAGLVNVFCHAISKNEKGCNLPSLLCNAETIFSLIIALFAISPK